MRRPLKVRIARAWRELLGPWPATEFPAESKGSDLTRLILDWVAACMSPDDEVRGSAKTLRARARELHRTNGYVASYLNLLDVNVIGPNGIGLESKVRDNDGDLNRGINKKIEEAWKRYAENPVTVDGKMNLHEYASMALTTTSNDGEAFTRIWRGDEFPDGVGFEGVDADLIDEKLTRRAVDGEPEIRMGVEVNRFGKPIRYHARTGYGSLFSGAGEGSYTIPASDIIHTMRGRRVNQTRGVTWLGPAMISLKMLDGYEESELVAARVSAAKMGFFQASQPENASEFGPQAANEPIEMNANPGTLEQLPIGWEFKEWSPDHPTSQFSAFVKGNLRKIATTLGVSYNALASDLEGVNYSSMRSGMAIERETWKKLQQWWIRQFMQRVFREWLVSALTRGILVLDAREFSRFLAVKWCPRGWQAVDPLKDTQAAVMGISWGLTSRTRVLAEQGLDPEDVIEELEDEAEIAKEHKVKITGTPKPTALASDEDEEDEEDEEVEAKENGKSRAAVVAAALAERRRRR